MLAVLCSIALCSGIVEHARPCPLVRVQTPAWPLAWAYMGVRMFLTSECMGFASCLGCGQEAQGDGHHCGKRHDLPSTCPLTAKAARPGKPSRVVICCPVYLPSFSWWDNTYGYACSAHHPARGYARSADRAALIMVTFHAVCGGGGCL